MMPLKGQQFFINFVHADFNFLHWTLQYKIKITKYDIRKEKNGKE